MDSSILPQKEVFINGRFLTQQTSGVQAFAEGICLELIAALPNLKILTPAKTTFQNKLFVNHIQEVGSLKGHFWEQYDLHKFMKSRPKAVLLNLCNTGPVQLTNQVVTLHDLAFIDNPKWFHPAFVAWYKFMIPRLVKNSKAIITVSETIKTELIKKYPVARNKIVVAGNKVSSELLMAEPMPTWRNVLTNQPYFLMVGTDNPRKNFKFIEQLFKDKYSEMLLVIAGGSNRNFRNNEHIQSENILRTGFTENGELKWLYQHAKGFINPSLYEGFGIPNLEAMAFDCPVLCSNLPVFTEICGEAAFYFENGNEKSLDVCIKEMLENKMLIETKTKKGKGIFTQIQSENRINKIIKVLF